MEFAPATVAHLSSASALVPSADASNVPRVPAYASSAAASLGPLPSAAVPDLTPTAARARLAAYGLSSAIAEALVGPALVAPRFAKRPLTRAAMVGIVADALVEAKKNANQPLDQEALDRAAAIAACAALLAAGMGAHHGTTALGSTIADHHRGSVGMYASEEIRSLTEAATVIASRGWTHGHDCWFHSVGSITGQTPDQIGSALGYHTSGYRTDGRHGEWQVALDLDELGWKHHRLGTYYVDERFGKARTHWSLVGFWSKDGDPIDQARLAMAATPVGSRFIIGISGHYLHAVHAADGVHFLDSQTLSGRTLVVPDSVVRANAEKFAGVEVTQLVAGPQSAVQTPAYLALPHDAFLRDCPFAWEPVPSAS